MGSASANVYLERELDRDATVWRTWVAALPEVAREGWWRLYDDSDAGEQFELQLLAGYLYPPYMAQESDVVIADRLLWSLHDLTHSYCNNDRRNPHPRSYAIASLVSITLKVRKRDDFTATRLSIEAAGRF